MLHVHRLLNYINEDKSLGSSPPKMTLHPRFAETNYYYSANQIASTAPVTPHFVHLYLDYDCIYSAKLFNKMVKAIEILGKKYPGHFQFVFFNTVQPWEPNSVMLNEFALACGQLLREKKAPNSNQLYWRISNTIFEHKEPFYDTGFTLPFGRNEVYKEITNRVFNDLKDLPFTKDEVLKKLVIPMAEDPAKYTNCQNEASVDVKYLTRYLRTVGAHFSPSVSVDGIMNDNINSSIETDEYAKILEGYL